MLHNVSPQRTGPPVSSTMAALNRDGRMLARAAQLRHHRPHDASERFVGKNIKETVREATG